MPFQGAAQAGPRREGAGSAPALPWVSATASGRRSQCQTDGRAIGLTFIGFPAMGRSPWRDIRQDAVQVNRPSTRSTLTRPPSASSPETIRREIGVSSCLAMARFSGRAPYTGS